MKNANVDCLNCPSRGAAIFCHLEKIALAGVSERKVMNKYKKGQTIYFQGNPSFGLYCINSGKIKISNLGSDGKESILRIASGGDALGHQNLFSEENYNATATVLEDAVLCFIDKRFIYQAVKEEPTIALNIIQKLSREMGSSEVKAAAMTQKNVRERLAELLLMLQKSYGIKEKNRTRLNIFLSREEMASMVGTANETLIRFISEFKAEGLIEQEKKTIFIKDEKRLLEFANLSY